MAWLSAALLQRRFGTGARQDGVARLLWLLVVSAGSGLLSTAAGAAMTVWAEASPAFWDVWYVWWLSVLLGVLSMTPLLLSWASLRFRLAGAAAVSFLLASLAVAWTAHGLGPMMLIEGTTAQRIVWLQAYLCVASFTSLALAAGVAEREQAREALRESERKIRAILDQTFQFIGLCRPDGTMVEANKSSLHLAGLRLDQVVGRPFWETP